MGGFLAPTDHFFGTRSLAKSKATPVFPCRGGQSKSKRRRGSQLWRERLGKQRLCQPDHPFDVAKRIQQTVVGSRSVAKESPLKQDESMMAQDDDERSEVSGESFTDTDDGAGSEGTLDDAGPAFGWFDPSTQCGAAFKRSTAGERQCVCFHDLTKGRCRRKHNGLWKHNVPGCCQLVKTRSTPIRHDGEADKWMSRQDHSKMRGHASEENQRMMEEVAQGLRPSAGSKTHPDSVPLKNQMAEAKDFFSEASAAAGERMSRSVGWADRSDEEDPRAPCEGSLKNEISPGVDACSGSTPDAACLLTFRGGSTPDCAHTCFASVPLEHRHSCFLVVVSLTSCQLFFQSFLVLAEFGLLPTQETSVSEQQTCLQIQHCVSSPAFKVFQHHT